MNILAIDPGLNMGWAIAIDGKLYESGVHRFTRTRSESPGAVYLRIRKWLLDASETVKKRTGNDFGLIAYETPHHRGGASTEVLCGIVTRLKEHAALISAPKEKPCEVVGVHTGSLKLHITGAGNADKVKVQVMMHQHWGVDIVNYDHSDALAVLKWAIDTYGQ